MQHSSCSVARRKLFLLQTSRSNLEWNLCLLKSTLKSPPITRQWSSYWSMIALNQPEQNKSLRQRQRRTRKACIHWPTAVYKYRYALAWSKYVYCLLRRSELRHVNRHALVWHIHRMGDRGWYRHYWSHWKRTMYECWKYYSTDYVTDYLLASALEWNEIGIVVISARYKVFWWHYARDSYTRLFLACYWYVHPLIGWLDLLAFEPLRMRPSFNEKTKTPSTNKQSPSGDSEGCLPSCVALWCSRLMAFLRRVSKGSSGAKSMRRNSAISDSLRALLRTRRLSQI